MKEIMVSRISSVRPTQTVTMQVLLLTNKTELCNTHTHTQCHADMSIQGQN